jgi:phosphate transport system substrate-binding protein
MKSNMKFFKDNAGVSPVIATLVLIVVAIIGAAAVGIIVSSFSSNVSQQASAGNTAGAASTSLTIAGSSSMLPTVTTLGAWYTSNTTGVKVNVNGGGSGVGYMSVEQGMADLGMISEHINSAQLVAYPSLKAFQIGESGVAFVTAAAKGTGSNANIPNDVMKADLVSLFTGVSAGNIKDHTGAAIGTALAPAPILATSFPVTDSMGNVWAQIDIRSDVSGTADTAMAYLGTTTASEASYCVGQNQNSGMEKDVVKSDSTLGYVDADYAFANIATYPLAVLNIGDATGNIAALPASTNGGALPGAGFEATKTTNGDNIITEIKTNPTNPTWPVLLCRPLNLISNGAPSSTASSFIQFCQAPTSANQNAFAADYQVHVSQVYNGAGSPFVGA